MFAARQIPSKLNAQINTKNQNSKLKISKPSGYKASSKPGDEADAAGCDAPVHEPAVMD